MMNFDVFDMVLELLFDVGGHLESSWLKEHFVTPLKNV